MDQKEKIENLKYTISRYDHYYDSVNSKSNVYLTLMTFLLGGTVALFRYAIDQKQLSTLNLVFLIITILIQIKGIMITLWALKPYLKSGTQKLNGSVFYFGYVASFTPTEFKQVYDALDYDRNYTDILNQAYQLASGLKKKYFLLFWSTVIIAVQIILLVAIGILLIKK